MIFFIKFFEYVFDTAGNSLDDMIYLLLALCVIVPLSLVNDVKVFKKTSFIANIFVIGTLLIIYMHNINEIAMGGEGI